MNGRDDDAAGPADRALSWAIGLATAAIFGAIALPMLQGRIYVDDDLKNYCLPLRAFYAECLARGDRFEWCPSLFCGFDLHGEGQEGLYHPLHLALPPLTLFSFSVFSKMTFGALCGLEYAAIFSGESRNPRRHFPRAILLAIPIVAVLYILGTSAILAFVPPASIDLIGPIPQALQIGFAGIAAARFIVPVAVLLLLTNYFSSFSLNFAANTRLPMVAGWDHLLPQWFTRLHPKYRTPVNSIVFLGAITLFAGMASLIGVRNLEAFSMLQVWGFTFYGLAYVSLFAIPLFAKKDSQLRPGFLLKSAAVSGLLLTLLFVVLSIFPVVDVASPMKYAAKTIAVLVGANALAIFLFLCQRRPVP